MFSQNHEAIIGFDTGTILERGIFWLYSQNNVKLRVKNHTAPVLKHQYVVGFVLFKSLALNLKTSGGSGTTAYRNTIIIPFYTNYRYIFWKSKFPKDLTK